ncbi:MAG: hydroxymethylglutaryl-CoA synthase [Acidobacteriota bacterium]|jgi:hydroxymethylglutaryl-CoA synthase
MKTLKQVGIVGYGAYVPRPRVASDAIATTWGAAGNGSLPVRRKSAPSIDEDTVTMSIEAARNALARCEVQPERIRAVWVGTESKPYAVKPSATIVAEAIGATPAVNAADMEFACKAGSEAMQTAVAFVGSGMAEYALAIGMDAAQSKPGDALEYTAAAGGAAFIFGPAEESLAIVEASHSHVTDTPDFFRRQHMHYPEHGHRFTGLPAYQSHTRGAAEALMESLGTTPADYRWAVFHQPNPKFPRRVARGLGFSAEQIAPGLVVDSIGNTYSGSSLLGLAAVLDVAEKGDRIFFCSYGSGAGSDAFSLVANGRLDTARRGAPMVGDYVGRAHEMHDYGQYLRVSGKIRML